MGAGILAVRAVGTEESFDDALHPTPSADYNGLLLRTEDGTRVWPFECTEVEVKHWTGEKWKTVEYIREVKATCYLTDCRVAVMCTKYDKGGGWIGGATALALNAGSAALAARRRSGKCLTAQIRYPWLSAVGATSKSGMLGYQMLGMRFHLQISGQRAPLRMDLTLPKHLDSHYLAAEIARRAAGYRLESGEHLLNAEDEATLLTLAAAEQLPNVEGQFAMHQFPGSWPVGASSADFPALVRRTLDARQRNAAEPTATAD